MPNTNISVQMSVPEQLPFNNNCKILTYSNDYCVFNWEKDYYIYKLSGKSKQQIKAME